MKNHIKAENAQGMFNPRRALTIIALAAVLGFSFGACDNGSTGGGGGESGLKADIDPVLAGTSWKDNMGGTSITVSFTSSGISWGGSSGSALNSTTSAYQGSGNNFVWIAKGGVISYKYKPQGGDVVTTPVYQYEKNGDTLLIKSNGTALFTMIPATSGGGGGGGGGGDNGGGGGDNGGGGGDNGGGLASEIDPELVGTSWKDNLNGTFMTLSFTSSSVTFGGSYGDQLNKSNSEYKTLDYKYGYDAKDGLIPFKYSYKGGPVIVVPFIAYEKTGDTIVIKMAGIERCTLIPQVEEEDDGVPIDIDLVDTAWEDEATGGEKLTVSFTSSSVSWGGEIGDDINYHLGWFIQFDISWKAKDGVISYTRSVMGMNPSTQPVATYEKTGDTFQITIEEEILSTEGETLSMSLLRSKN